MSKKLFISYFLLSFAFGQSLGKLSVPNLSSNTIYSAFHSKSGILWIGTDQGLNRFDGISNDVFRSNPFSEYALNGNRAWFIDHYSKDTLMVISDNAIHLFGNKDYKFNRYNIESRPTHYSKLGKELWIATYSSGIYRLDAQKKLHHLRFDPLDPFTVSTSNFTSNTGNKFAYDIEGNVWLATNQGLNFIQSSDNTVKRFFRSNTDNLLLSDNVTAVFFDDGVLYIGTDKGLNYLDLATGQFTIENNINNESVINIVKKDEEILLFLKENIYSIKNNVLTTYRDNISVDSFLGNERTGLFWAKGKKTVVLGDKTIDIGSEVHSVLAIENDDFFFTTEDGIKVLSSKEAVVKTSNISLFNKDNIFLSKLYGSKHFDAINSRFDLSTIDDYLFLDNYFWFVSEGVAGRWNFNEDAVDYFEFNARNPNSFPQSVSSLVLFENDLWVGSIETGLYRFDIENLSLKKHYQFDMNESNSLQTSIVSDLLVDSSNKLWVGSGGDGLFLYDTAIDGFIHKGIEDGLTSTIIIQLFSISDIFFVNTRSGINYFQFDDISFSSLDGEDGLNIQNYDELMFYTVDEQLIIKDETHKYSITYSDLDNMSFSSNPIIKSIVGLDSYNNEHLLPFNNGQVDISPSITSILLDVSVPSFYKANQGRYSYSFGSSLDVPTITKKAGEKIVIPKRGYRNQKLLLLSSGVNTNPIELDFNYIAPWYYRWWSVTSYIIIIFGAIYVYSSNRAKKLQRRMEQARKSEELEAARDLQLQLLAKKIPEMENIEVETYIQTATEVGGDYFDFLETEEGVVIAACGDATGHGTTSGMMVSITKAGLKGIKKQAPNKMLTDLNNIVKSVDIGRLRMSLNLLEFKNSHVNISSAAMPPVYHFSNIDNSVSEIELVGTPLGSFYDEEFDSAQVQFSEGDAIVILSDGLPEAPNRDGKMLDYPAVMDCIKNSGSKSAREIKVALIDLAESWLDGTQNPDDITFLIFKKKELVSLKA